MIEYNDNYSNYKKKIETYVRDNQTGHFLKEIVWKPNIALSIISQSGNNSPKPLLATIKHNTKLYHFYFGALIHFTTVTLKKQRKKAGEFSTKYFNFNKLAAMVDYNYFFGLSSQNKTELNLMSFIMSNEYFNGLPESISYDRFIYNLFQYNLIDYMNLVLKYHVKNEQCIVNCINKLPEDGIVKLLNKLNREEWFDIVFVQLLKLIPTSKAKINEKALQKGYQFCCQKRDKHQIFGKLGDMIQHYAKLTNQSLDSA